jgi:hypothetical protein
MVSGSYGEWFTWRVLRIVWQVIMVSALYRMASDYGERSAWQVVMVNGFDGERFLW